MSDWPRLLVLRADADSRTGSGHVMRALALAQEWQGQGGAAVVVGHIADGPLRQRLDAAGLPVVNLPARHPAPQDLTALLPWLHQRRGEAGWVALDGYHFDPAYQQALRATGWPLLIIDDYAHLPTYHADILVNPNAYAEAMHYQTAAQTLILRGTRFVPLRKEFRQAVNNDAAREKRPGRRLLVTMGGADPDNVTAKVIAALQAMARSDLEVVIIVGPLNPHRQALAERVRHAGLKVEVLTAVTDMVPHLRWADLAISAAGSTCWELAALGVPMVVTVLADNQERLAASLAAQGAAVNLGWHHAWQAEQAARVWRDLLDSPPQRQAMGAAGQRLVDGQGCTRVLRAMRGYHFALRPAIAADCETLFQWANDPLTRAASFSQAAITWQEHCRWFAARLADHDHLFFIAITPGGSPMAQARFSRCDTDEAVISVSLAPDFRGLGLGARLIRRACQQALAARPVTKIRALIKQGNSASVHAFRQAGFRHHATVEVSGHPAVAMDYYPQEEGVAA